MLLMAERQTTGGYPVVAIVITADLGQAAQLAPADDVRFVLVSHADAVRALLEQDARARETHERPSDPSDTFVEALRTAAPAATVERDAPLARLTTLRVGGTADLLVSVASAT